MRIFNSIWRQQHDTLRTRFFLAFILIGIIPISLIGFLIIRLESRSLTEQATHELAGVAQGFADELDTFITELLRDARAIASLPGVVRQDPEHREFLLQLLHQEYTSYGQLAIVDLDGQISVVAREQEMVNISHIHSFQSVVNEGKQDWVIAPALFSDNLLLHMHTPILNEEMELVAALGSPVPLGNLTGVLEEIENGRAFVLDETGRILLHPDPAERVARRSYAEWIFSPDGEQPKSIGTTQYSVDNVAYVVGYAPIESLGWTVVVERPESVVLMPVTQASSQLGIGLLLTILLSLVIAFLLANGLTSPVRNLAIAAQALGAGNPDVPLPENIKSGREIRMLMFAFLNMRDAVIDREAGLRRSEARNRAIVDAIPDTLLRVNKTGFILDMKSPEGSALSLDPMMVMGHEFREYLHQLGDPSFTQQMQNSFEHVLETGQTQLFESKIIQGKDAIEIEAQLVISGENEMLIILRDMTERKRAEAAIRKHLSAMEASSEGMAILNVDTRFTYVNDAYVKIHEYENADDLIGLSWPAVYTEKEIQRLEKEIVPVVMKAQVWRGEATGKKRDGSTYHQDLTLTLLDSGECVCVARDITEQQQAKEALRQAQKLDSLGILAGGIAHDFNNLLTGMLGHATIAQELIDPYGPAKMELEKVVASATRAADLTRQLLAYAGKGYFAIGPLDLNQMIRKNQDLMETAIPSRVKMVMDLKPDLPTIEADRGQIQQVLMNLVLNAAESFTDAGGQVCIRTYTQKISSSSRPPDIDFSSGTALSPGTYVCLEVKDNGSGMDSETLSRVFDPFYTTKSNGTGLGLSATLGIVRSHKGSIQVDSKPGKGTTFRVLFIASTKPVRTVVPAAKTRESLSGKALVIDDQETIRQVASTMLQSRGMDVLVANGGHEGLALYETNMPEIDVVLLDMKMPGLDGEETYLRLKEIDPNVSVIVVSGYSEKEAMSHFVHSGKVDFLQKPFHLDALITKVKQILMGRKSEQ